MWNSSSSLQAAHQVPPGWSLVSALRCTSAGRIQPDWQSYVNLVVAVVQPVVARLCCVVAAEILMVSAEIAASGVSTTVASCLRLLSSPGCHVNCCTAVKMHNRCRLCVCLLALKSSLAGHLYMRKWGYLPSCASGHAYEITLHCVGSTERCRRVSDTFFDTSDCSSQQEALLDVANAFCRSAFC
jgi:hypothetical protein